MHKRSRIYWYNEEPAVANAFLYNCRDDDLEPVAAGQIDRGAIVLGKNGVAIAESAVPSLQARRIAAFNGTRRCAWGALELSCMVHLEIGQRAMTTRELRHVGCIVALLPDSASVAFAIGLGVPVVEDTEGHRLVNLSVERHAGQSKDRRATLL